MWVRRVTSIAGAAALGAGLFIGATVIPPASVMRVALAEPADDTAPAAGAPAPAEVAAAVLLPGMDPAALSQNPDGSLVYHGTTPAGVDTPGWATVTAPDGSIVMVRGPVAPGSAPAGPPQSSTAEPYRAEGAGPLPDEAASGPGTMVSSPDGTVWLPEGAALAPQGPEPEPVAPQP